MARKLTNKKIFQSNLKVNHFSFLALSLKSMTRCWYYSIPAFIFSICLVSFLVENIFITSKITDILVSQNFVDIVTNKKSIAKILLCGTILDPQEFDKYYQQIMQRQATIPASAIKQLINELYGYNIIVTSLSGKVILSSQIWPLNLFYSSAADDPGLTVKGLSLFIAINLLIVIIATYLTYLFAGWMAESEKSRLKNELISKLIDQDIHYISHNKISNLIGTIVSGTENYSKNLKLIPILFFQAFATIIETTFIMMQLNSWMTIVIFINISIIGAVVSMVMLLKKISNKSIAKNKKIVDDTISERLHAMQLVKASGTWTEETNYLKDLNYKISKKTMKSLPLTELMSAIIIGGIGTFAMCSIIAGIFKYNDDINSLLSVMTTFTTAALVITLPLLQLNAVLPEIQKCEKSARGIDKILRSKIMIQQNGEIVFKHLKDAIEIDNISFSYPDKEEEFYLVNQSFRFERGKRYAFIGATGSGKSTIAKLLIRFYDPTVGKVKVDGVDLKDYNLKSWLDKVGYVEQEPQILLGTILENIKYVKPDATNEEVFEACKKAKIHDFIMSLNDKYNTMLFERGAQLSGGQKQRLVIARMFVKNPEVLILDEPTSALDNIVESEIQEELEKLMVGRTTIAIAHRLNTIKNFDHIIVLGYKKGVIKRASFDELCKSDKGILDMIKQ